MTSFADQKRRIATKEDCRIRWFGGEPGENFRCSLCGRGFKPGDGWRWVYGGHIVEGSGGQGLPNFIVCDACDGPDVCDKWLALWNEFYSDKFWYLRRGRDVAGW